MSQPNITAAISNLTEGGGVVYMEHVIKHFNKVNKAIVFHPKKNKISSNKFLNLLIYIKYIYFDLFFEYLKISLTINLNTSVNKVIVFQDSYLKAPYSLLFLKKKTIYILHEPPREFYEPVWLHAPNIYNRLFNYTIRYPVKFLDHFLTRRASLIVANSNYSKEIIKKIYNKESKVVYPGVEPKVVKNETKIIKKNCISVGSLLGYKGHKKTILSISKINKNTRPSLVVVGNGTNTKKKELLKMASELGVRVTIKSHLSDKELEREYQKAKVYINNAYFEPFGLTSLESIMFGCNLVTNNTGGTKELKKYFPKNVYISHKDSEMPILIENALSATSKSINISTLFNWKNIAKVVNEL